ncbi:MAG: DUF4190 domain-containing protein, partial [Actinomycetota bacterium]|nr:DUF4190 domain-containing protein [Actinomycetota bacterium]
YPGGQPYPAQGGEPYPGGQAYPAQGGEPYSGGGPYGGGTPPRRGSGMAVAALVLGILGLITSITVLGGIVFGLLGIILGIVASKRAKRGEAAGRGMAIAGIATGALALLVVIGLIIAGASLLNSKAGKNLQTCLSDANGNQAQIQSCNDQFRSQVGP